MRALRRRGRGEGLRRGGDEGFRRERFRHDDDAAVEDDAAGRGVRVEFIEDDVVLAENVMSVMSDLPVEPPDDVLGVSL